MIASSKESHFSRRRVRRGRTGTSSNAIWFLGFCCPLPVFGLFRFCCSVVLCPRRKGVEAKRRPKRKTRSPRLPTNPRRATRTIGFLLPCLFVFLGASCSTLVLVSLALFVFCGFSFFSNGFWAFVACLGVLVLVGFSFACFKGMFFSLTAFYFYFSLWPNFSFLFAFFCLLRCWPGKRRTQRRKRWNRLAARARPVLTILASHPMYRKAQFFVWPRGWPRKIRNCGSWGGQKGTPES